MTKAFQIIAYTAPGVPEPSIAIAASRADSLGVLDLEYTRDKQAALSAIEKLSIYARNEFGIKLDSNANEFQDEVISELPPQLSTVVLTCSEIHVLEKSVRALRSKKLKVLLEANCQQQAEIGEQLGVDGVIAKGHEAGGRIGEETTFVLLQRFLNALKLPVWAHGGVGLHTVAACYSAGVAGIVLDAQLALCRESPLHESVKAKISGTASETICLGDEVGETYRVYAMPYAPVLKEIHQEQDKLLRDTRSSSEIKNSWRQTIFKRVGYSSLQLNLLPFGQDLALSVSLAARFGTVGGVIKGFRESIDSHCRSARNICCIDEGSPLARSHGTRYPIVQGPMARVSDTPAFALAVAEAGGLPFLAISLMEADQLRSLLGNTRNLLGDRPWGVGIMGFLPPDLLREQIEVICEYRPPYAIIGGGRPNQNKPLIKAGIHTYLHVPSRGLLQMFLRNGDRRFIFGGRESGGHVGPGCSFPLWETMIDELLKFLSPDKDASEYHVLFAGGIHDALSASMVAAMAAPLAERGVRVGVQMGTAYLFTEEAVKSQAIVNTYQQEALICQRTVVLEVGPGHANRCTYTPFAEAFKEKKRRLKQEGRPADEIRFELDKMCIGRLNLAAKGISPEGIDKSSTEVLSEEEQRANGMYLIGQIGAIRKQIVTIDALHDNISVEGSRRLESVCKAHQENVSPVVVQEPSDIAIIGMACIMPKAHDLQSYWGNIINKVNTITEVPKERWDWELYYDQDPKAKDKVYCKWGGFLDDILFDPAEYGIPPNSLYSIEPLQLLTLEVVKKALIDSGYYQRQFNREGTSVILGISGGAGDLGQKYGIRTAFPMLFKNGSTELLSHFADILPEWTEDSFPGILANVAAGRISNRFDLRGVNFVVDAACASSLAAAYLAVKELETRSSDMVIVAGADTMQSPFAYMCFSKTLALSPSGQTRAFDETADGIVLGEGVAAVILKRLADAERDGDKVYAVIKGIGFSSDGRAKGLTAPHLEGQVLALKRAYQKANVSPATLDLIEGHGTGTEVGDKVEIQALSQVFASAQAARQGCAIGSLKSMIGHTKSTAGVASLIKAALALQCKVLPPTLGVSKPNSIFNSADSPFYVNTETRPWIKSSAENPRRAGVSAFGFGGTNFHAVLEEYTSDYSREEMGVEAVCPQWSSELIIMRGNSYHEILQTIERLENFLSRGAKPRLHDLAYTLSRINEQEPYSKEHSDLRLAVVATSLEDLRRKLTRAREALTSSETKPSGNIRQISDPGGIYFSEQPLGEEGKVAFLFPGQGSQYINMLKDLTIQFQEVRTCFERANKTLQHRLSKVLTSYIFPQPVFNNEEQVVQNQALAQTNIAQPAVGAADMAMFHLLAALGVHPDLVAGHSYGEYVSLCAAGVFNEDTLIALSEYRGRFIVEAAGKEPGTMAAVDASAQAVAEVLAEIENVYIANLNAPEQTVISGASTRVQEAMAKFEAKGIRSRLIPVACAFHSPIVSAARQHLAQFLSNIKLAEPQVPVFSNTTASPYPQEPRAIAELMVKHLVSQVRFVDEVEALYEAGARIFVEVGPRSVLSKLIEQNLKSKPHLTVSSDGTYRSGLLHLHHLLAQLFAHGVPVKLDRLYRGREPKLLDLDTLEKETDEVKTSSTTWLVNGGRAIPLSKAGASHLTQQKPAHPVVVDHQLPLDKLVREKMAEPKKYIIGSPDSSLSTNDQTKVMAQFHRIMNRFLDTQESIMRTYLEATSNSQGFHDSVKDVTTIIPPKEVNVVPVGKREEKPAPNGNELKLETDILPRWEKLTSNLLQIVSERTGYPQEMIDLDADLEADLGIDSIKRIEILGNFRDKYAWSDDQNMDQVMEQLAGIKTLRGIVDWMKNSLKSVKEEIDARLEESALDSEISQVAGQEMPDEEAIHRLTLSTFDLPLTGQPDLPAPNGVIVLTDDEKGVAQALAEELQAGGYPVALVRTSEEPKLEISNCGLYTADLTSSQSIDQLLKLIRRQHGPIAGLIHLAPLSSDLAFQEMDLEGWKKHLRLEVKSLFHFAKSLHSDLKQAAQNGGAWFVAATMMGGTFSSVPLGELAAEIPNFSPSQGGVTGLLKTIAVEYPELQVKAIDLNHRESPSALASKLMQEIAARDGQVEVGYQGHRRIVLQLSLSPLEKKAVTSVEIDPSWVILVTGGAQGITADVACELARHYRPTLLLVGRSPLPGSQEPDEIAGLEGKELKAVLANRLSKEGQPVKPAQVEAVYIRLLKDREMRTNIAAMRSHGANVHYYQADVRDEKGFGNLIDHIYQSYGRLDGVIHGAGIIEDKLVNDKAAESFDRVFDTKVESAFILSRKLKPDSLKFLVFFSSVAGRFGNRGQCDYTAANEVYNKLAIHLDKQWPGRVVSVMWGPWAGSSGMASPELQKQFAKAGVVLIPRSVGPRKLDEELRYGRKGEAEVVIGSILLPGKGKEGLFWEQSVKADKEDTTPLSLPLLGNMASLIRGETGSVEIVRHLDLAQDLYLQDHRLDGKPVLPMAMALELMAETLKLGWPKLELATVKDMRILQGIVLEHDSMPIRVLARPRNGASSSQLEVEVSICGSKERRRVYNQATVELVSQLPLPPRVEPLSLMEPHPFQMSIHEVYDKWLFHGPRFQRINHIDGIGSNGIIGWLSSSSPQQSIAGANQGHWLIDPMILDSGLQLGIIWTRLYRDMTILPSRFNIYKRYGALADPKIECHLRVFHSPGSHIIHADLAFFGAEGRLLGLLKDVEGTCSKSLNRLAAGHLQ